MNTLLHHFVDVLDHCSIQVLEGLIGLAIYKVSAGQNGVDHITGGFAVLTEYR